MKQPLRELEQRREAISDITDVALELLTPGSAVINWLAGRLRLAMGHKFLDHSRSFVGSWHQQHLWL